MNEELLKGLNEEEQKKIKEMPKLKQYIVFCKLIPKIYNSLCVECKVKVQTEPKLKLDEYCNKCKDMIIEKLRNYIK